MSRIAIPATIADVPAAARPQLEGVQRQLGSVPNLFRLVATSPAALAGYLGLAGALGQGALDARTRERIAVAIAETNGCTYCLSAHSYLGAHRAQLDLAELAANRDGGSSDPVAAAAVRFAVQVARARGHVRDADLAAVRAAGYDDAQVLEIVLHVALNTLTNYVNSVADTDVDFPVVAVRPR
ncbi:MAG: carboxymuconolactone decarboxylase family protein [Myxococcales bacterium]|nr:carboxymuconolactone decarboxylase family protein [Myxococcales bacterium]